MGDEVLREEDCEARGGRARDTDREAGPHGIIYTSHGLVPTEARPSIQTVLNLNTHEGGGNVSVLRDVATESICQYLMHTVCQKPRYSFLPEPLGQRK